MHTRRFVALRGLLGGLVAFILFAGFVIGMATDGSIKGAASPPPALIAQTPSQSKATLPAVKQEVHDAHELGNDRHHR